MGRPRLRQGGIAWRKPDSVPYNRYRGIGAGPFRRTISLFDGILRIALGSDERTHLIEFIDQELRSRGHQVNLVGPPAGQSLQWADVARIVAESVSSADAENVEKLNDMDRRYRTRRIPVPVEGEKGRI